MLKTTKLLLTMTIALTIGLFGAVAKAQDLPEPGVWSYEKVIDEFTDEVSHHLVLVAKKIPEYDTSIIIICEENITEFLTFTSLPIVNETFGTNNSWETDYRIDDLKAQKFKTIATDSVFGHDTDSVPIPLIKSMFGHNKLLVRFEKYDGTRPTATFNITGIEDEIKPIRQACNW